MKNVAILGLLLSASLTACVADNDAPTSSTHAAVSDPSEDPCVGLDDATCRATDGCHVNQHDQAINDVSVFSFDSCSGGAPDRGVDCWELDEATCGTHDDCITVRKVDDDGTIYFADCENEDGSGPTPNKDDDGDFGG